MLLLDDILLSPFNGILWVANKIHEAAQQELDGEKDSLTAALSDLYMRLESRQITEEEFSVREKEMLDRLEEIQQRESRLGMEDEEAGEADESGVEDDEPDEDAEGKKD